MRSLELLPVPAAPPQDTANGEKEEDADLREADPLVLFEVKEEKDMMQRVTVSVRIDGERVLLGYSAYRSPVSQVSPRYVLTSPLLPSSQARASFARLGSSILIRFQPRR